MQSHTKYSKNQIELWLKEGKTLKEIGFFYGVSKQRLYQVIEFFNIETPERKRKNQKRTWDNKCKWVWKMLTHKFPLMPKHEKLELLEKLKAPDCCPVLGIPLNYNLKGNRTDEGSPSIDKIIPQKEYTKENIIIISWKANRIKNNGTPEDHYKIWNFYKNLKENT